MNSIHKWMAKLIVFAYMSPSQGSSVWVELFVLMREFLLLMVDLFKLLHKQVSIAIQETKYINLTLLIIFDNV